VRFDAVVQNGMTAEAIDDSTMCDIIIIKVVGEPHQLTVAEINVQFGIYSRNQLNQIIRPGGGRRLFIINAAGNTSSHQPDVTLTTPNNIPTIIVELEDKNPSLDKQNLWCRGFLHTPGVSSIGYSVWLQQCWWN
jgi:hypothetical protein